MSPGADVQARVRELTERFLADAADVDAAEGRQAGNAGSWGGWDSNPGPADYESAALTG
jgi:hypothetical protein